MRLVILVSLCLVGLSSKTSFAQGWSEFIDEAERFIVNFPGDPVVEETGYLTQNGATMPARVYTVEIPPSRYVVTVVNYTEAERIYEEHCTQRGGEDWQGGEACDGNEAGLDVRGAIALAAWNIRRRGGEVIFDSYHEIDGVPGIQLQIVEADNSQTFAGIYMHARRLYILEGNVPGDYPPPALFQQSIGVLDEDGEPINIEYDENDYPVLQ